MGGKEEERERKRQKRKENGGNQENRRKREKRNKKRKGKKRKRRIQKKTSHLGLERTPVIEFRQACKRCEKYVFACCLWENTQGAKPQAIAMSTVGKNKQKAIF